MEDIEFLKRNLRLRTLCIHELLSSNERGRQEVEWLIIATVDDDTHGGRVINEVLGQGFERELVGVVLDEFLEDIGGLVGIAIREAVAVVRNLNCWLWSRYR